jgi:hypothetical protein
MAPRWMVAQALAGNPVLTAFGMDGYGGVLSGPGE